MADAGENLICAAVYARYKLRNGGYSCQLIFARTKVIHGLTIPRAELAAALLNASTGHVVHLSLKDMHKRSWKTTDSQVALHWICCTKSLLKLWVRNRMLEVKLNDRSSWFYVLSRNNVADLGTSKGTKIEHVSPDSPWIQGQPWMQGLEENVPLKSVNEHALTGKEKKRGGQGESITECLRLARDTNFLIIYLAQINFVPALLLECWH